MPNFTDANPANLSPPAGLNGVWYNSCRHRSCPQCAWAKIQEWLEAKKALLLDVDHYHVTLTLPHQFLPLWRWNRKALADLLFRCAADTLLRLLGDPKYSGAKPGTLISLHTWSRTLALHPHVHCLVSGGGLCPEGTWKGAVRQDILLPVKVVRKLFTGMFQGRLQALIQGPKKRYSPLYWRIYHDGRFDFARASSSPSSGLEFAQDGRSFVLTYENVEGHAQRQEGTWYRHVQ